MSTNTRQESIRIDRGISLPELVANPNTKVLQGGVDPSS